MATAEETLTLSEEDVQKLAQENEDLKRERAELRLADVRRGVDDRLKAMEKKGVPAATRAEIEEILLGDEGETILTLSEGKGAAKKQVDLTLSEAIGRVLDSIPDSVWDRANLAEDPASDEDATGEKPGEQEDEQLGLSERTYRRQRFLHGPDAAKERLQLSDETFNKFEERATKAESSDTE